MKKTLVTLTIGTFLVPFALNAQPIQNFMDFELVSAFAPGKALLTAGDHTLDTNPTSPGLFEATFGQISGNTVTRSQFETAVANAFAQGLGGVITFEDAQRSFSGGDFIHPTTGTTINRFGADRIRAGGVEIARGPNWWFEGTYSGSPFGPYRGKHEPSFDGTGPSGPDRANYSEIFFFTTESNAARQEIGEKSLGQTTSFDLLFNPADGIIMVGFAGLNWSGNFQSQQDTSKEFAFYPNMHTIATFTDGTTTIQQMSVGLTSIDPGNDYFFGFAAPDGFSLERLQFYAIGNNSRVFVSMDDLAFVQIPEPRVYALLFGLLALAGVALRRRLRC